MFYKYVISATRLHNWEKGINFLSSWRPSLIVGLITKLFSFSSSLSHTESLMLGCDACFYLMVSWENGIYFFLTLASNRLAKLLVKLQMVQLKCCVCRFPVFHPGIPSFSKASHLLGLIIIYTFIIIYPNITHSLMHSLVKNPQK